MPLCDISQSNKPLFLALRLVRGLCAALGRLERGGLELDVLLLGDKPLRFQAFHLRRREGAVVLVVCPRRCL